MSGASKGDYLRRSANRRSYSYSVDFASVFFADQLLDQPCNRRLNEEFF